MEEKELTIKSEKTDEEIKKLIYTIRGKQENSQVFERLTNVEYKLLEHDKKFNEVFDQLQLEM